MTPERWKLINELLDDVLDHEPAERAPALTRACAGDTSLYREVESLLAALEQASGFMESLPAQAGELFDVGQPVIGQMVGAYRLLREIGRGGMGLVYLAARADQEFIKLVAIKVAWPGANRVEVLQRFRQERQILASLDHPNISRLLDGGTTEQSLPYVVMEYIAGTPITDYCDRRGLPITERLKLFLTVCSAVHFAHQNLIIHRDLKPGNILITDDGTVKLLDFGIAKLLHSDLQGVDLAVTQTGLLPMTPEYASPEQVRGVVVTTATDVYSLGVVLYELLTGHRPYRLAGRSPLELERALCETEPEKPSAAINRTEYETGKDGVSRPKRTPESVSRTREGKPERLRARLRGDLDSITLKALRKEPRERYSSVEQFAADIRRHLSGNAVQAQKPTVTYRASRFLRRHKVTATVAALFVLMLIAGILVTTRQARIARSNARDYRRTLYAAQMNLAGQAWDSVNLERLEELLEANRPRPGEEDLRGFEWYYLWQLYHTARPRMTLYHDDQVWTVALSPDGKRLAAGGEDNVVKVWDVATGEELLTLVGHEKWVNAVTFSPDGKRLATASGDKTVKLWDAATGQEVATFGGYGSRVNAVVFSPDGLRLFTSSDGKAIKVWDTASGREIASYSGHADGMIRSLAVSPNGKRLATAGHYTVALWDVDTGKEMALFQGFLDNVLAVTFSPDGKRLAVASADKTTRIWDAATGKEIVTLKGHASWVDCVAFSPDGKKVATGSADRTIKLWDVATGQELASLRGHLRPVESVVFSLDGQQLISASLDHTVRVWSIADLKEPTLVKASERLTAYSQAGQELAATGAGSIRLLNVAGGQERIILTASSKFTHALALSPDGQRLITYRFDGMMRMFDAVSEQELASFKGHAGTVEAISFSPDGKQIATGGDDSMMKLWDTVTYQEIASIKAHEGRVRCLAFSPDGKQIATGGDDKQIKLWDLASARKIITLTGHTDSVNSLVFSADGRTLISGSADLTAKLWDVATGREIRTFRGHADQVKSVALSHDGLRLATASFDGTVRLWDVATGQELIVLKGHTDFVQFVAFSDDDRILTSGSRDQTIRFWRAATTEEVVAQGKK